MPLGSDADGPEVMRPGPRPGSKADRSIGALLSDLAAECTLLFRQELALLRAELSEKFVRLGQGAVALGAGVLLLFSGWLVLLAAAVLGLANVLPPWLAALLVGGAVLLLGIVLLLVGKSRLDPDKLVPRRSLNSLRQDQVWLGSPRS